MSNHGFVKTQEPMPPEKISLLLDELNDSHFKGILSYEYSEHPNDTSTWGPHIWMIKCGVGLIVTWLNDQRSWEVRHGGGSSFARWMESVIINEIAIRFDGTISDEGVEEEWKGEPGKYKTFEEFYEMVLQYVKEPDVKRALWQQEQKYFVPEVFHIDLGEEIELPL
jgi:hypothetical protein